MKAFFVVYDCYPPLVLLFVPDYAFIFRRPFVHASSAVPVVLGVSSESEIGLSVVESVDVYVVNDNLLWGGDNLSVHKYHCFFARPADVAFSVICSAVTCGEPIVFPYPVKIVRVNNGVLTLAKRNLSERVAEPGSTIQKQEPDAESL